MLRKRIRRFANERWAPSLTVDERAELAGGTRNHKVLRRLASDGVEGGA